MHRYKAFGLKIASEIALDELETDSFVATPDIYVRLLPIIDQHQSVTDEPEIKVHEGSAVIAFSGVARFELQPQSNTITVAPVQGASALLSLPLLGPVLAVWMHLQGDLVLHASAVSINGRVFAFIGDKGAGKSTLAAALVRFGARLVTDDLLRLRWNGTGATLCECAYPQIKLTDAAATAFAPSNATPLESPHPDFPKQRWKLEEALSEALPLASINVPVRGLGVRFASIDLADALRICLEQVFVRRYGACLLTGGAGARQFSQVVRLVNGTSVTRLVVPHGLTAFAEAGSEIYAALDRTDG